MVNEIYDILTDLELFGYGGLVGLFGEVLALSCIALLVLTPVMVCWAIAKWIARGGRYDN